ncbi:MAG: rRNA maturation RNase YbeY [Anaerolineales bacterium]|nr:rRNA maturation RNase YbeY [Anaerolineales bacterium]
MKRKPKHARPARSVEVRRTILIRREPRLAGKVTAAAVRRAVLRALEHQSFREDCSISLVLAGEETVARLNARYRGVPQATDVLAFPSRVVDPQTAVRHLGDVLICLPRAAAQASARGKTLEDEVLLLAVHGTLHLLGHDHHTARKKKRMWDAQKQILKEPA